MNEHYDTCKHKCYELSWIIEKKEKKKRESSILNKHHDHHWPQAAWYGPFTANHRPRKLFNHHWSSTCFMVQHASCFNMVHVSTWFMTWLSTWFQVVTCAGGCQPSRTKAPAALAWSSSSGFKASIRRPPGLLRTKPERMAIFTIKKVVFIGYVTVKKVLYRVIKRDMMINIWY